MARTAEIKDGGSRSVNLINTGATGFIPIRGGFGGTRFKPHQLDAAKQLDDILFVERWALHVKGSSVDNLASQQDGFIELLRAAYLYHANDPTERKPIYLQEQLTGELNVRYAMVYASPEIANPDMFGGDVEIEYLIRTMGVSIARGPWESAPPGSAGSALTLAPMWDGGVAQESDFDSVTENGSSALADDGKEIKVTIDSSQNTTYGEVTAPSDTKLLTVQYKLRPSSLTIGTDDNFTEILLKDDASVGGQTNYALLAHGYNGTNHWLRIGAYEDDGSYSASSVYTFTDSEITVLIEAATATGAGQDDGYVKFWIDGELQETISGLDNDQKVIDYFRIGAVTGIDAGTEGDFYISNIQYALGRSATPTKVHIANSRNDTVLDRVYNVDADGADAEVDPGDSLFPGPVGQNDLVQFRATEFPVSIVIPALQTAGSLDTSTLQLGYTDDSGDDPEDAADYSTLTLGTNYTCYPGATLTECLEQTDEDIVINITPPSDADQVGGYYYVAIIEANASPSYSQNPVTDDTAAIYVQSKPYIEIPNTVLKGNTRAKTRLVMKAPYGGDDNEGFANTSLVIASARSIGLGANQFASRLNLGNQGNPTGVTVTEGADATFTQDSQAPGDYHCLIDFSGDETLVNRCQVALADKLEYYTGKFRVFAKLQQVGGSAGDIEIMLRTFIGATDTYATHFDTHLVPTEGADEGQELLEVSIRNPGGTLKIPFGGIVDADDLSGVNLYFQIHAKRKTGSGQLKLYELGLCAVDEWTAEYPDPKTDTVSGSSALRGNTGLEDDAGVIEDRTFKFINAQTTPVLGETWTRGGKPPTFEPSKQYRIYFWFGHYPASGTWGTGPFIASPGMHMTFEMYAHNLYYALRGAG